LIIFCNFLDKDDENDCLKDLLEVCCFFNCRSLKNSTEKVLMHNCTGYSSIRELPREYNTNLYFTRVMYYLSICDKFQLFAFREYLLDINFLNAVFDIKHYESRYNNILFPWSYYLNEIKMSCGNKSSKYELVMQFLIHRISSIQNTVDACEAKSFRHFFDKYFYDDEILDLSNPKKRYVGETKLQEFQSDFTTQSTENDVNVIVENNVLFVSSTILSLCSPVFKAMLNSSMKEAELKTIELPGKQVEHVTELFLYFHKLKSVNGMIFFIFFYVYSVLYELAENIFGVLFFTCIIFSNEIISCLA